MSWTRVSSRRVWLLDFDRVVDFDGLCEDGVGLQDLWEISGREICGQSEAPFVPMEPNLEQALPRS
jgi:hypothetical protein